MKKLAALVLFTVLFSFAAAPVFAAPAPKAGWPQQLKFMAGPPGGKPGGSANSHGVALMR